MGPWQFHAHFRQMGPLRQKKVSTTDVNVKEAINPIPQDEDATDSGGDDGSLRPKREADDDAGGDSVGIKPAQPQPESIDPDQPSPDPVEEGGDPDPLFDDGPFVNAPQSFDDTASAISNDNVGGSSGSPTTQKLYGHHFFHTFPTPHEFAQAAFPDPVLGRSRRRWLQRNYGEIMRTFPPTLFQNSVNLRKYRRTYDER